MKAIPTVVEGIFPWHDGWGWLTGTDLPPQPTNDDRHNNLTIGKLLYRLG